MRTPPKMTHDEMVKKWMQDPEFVKECELLKPEFELLNAVLAARKEQNMTQAELAKRVGTQKSNISRLESGNYNPSLDFL